jgi:hypothetical protein
MNKSKFEEDGAAQDATGVFVRAVGVGGECQTPCCKRIVSTAAFPVIARYSR